MDFPRYVFLATGEKTYESELVTDELGFNAAIEAGWYATILEAFDGEKKEDEKPRRGRPKKE